MRIQSLQGNFPDITFLASQRAEWLEAQSVSELQLGIRSESICKSFGDPHRLLEPRPAAYGDCGTGYGADEETQLPVAGLASEELQHRLRIGTGQPLVLRHCSLLPQQPVLSWRRLANRTE